MDNGAAAVNDDVFDDDASSKEASVDNDPVDGEQTTPRQRFLSRLVTTGSPTLASSLFILTMVRLPSMVLTAA